MTLLQLNNHPNAPTSSAASAPKPVNSNSPQVVVHQNPGPVGPVMPHLHNSGPNMPPALSNINIQIPSVQSFMSAMGAGVPNLPPNVGPGPQFQGPMNNNMPHMPGVSPQNVMMPNNNIRNSITVAKNPQHIPNPLTAFKSTDKNAQQQSSSTFINEDPFSFDTKNLGAGTNKAPLVRKKYEYVKNPLTGPSQAKAQAMIEEIQETRQAEDFFDGGGKFLRIEGFDPAIVGVPEVAAFFKFHALNENVVQITMGETKTTFPKACAFVEFVF